MARCVTVSCDTAEHGKRCLHASWHMVCEHVLHGLTCDLWPRARAPRILSFRSVGCSLAQGELRRCYTYDCTHVYLSARACMQLRKVNKHNLQINTNSQQRTNIQPTINTAAQGLQDVRCTTRQIATTNKHINTHNIRQPREYPEELARARGLRDGRQPLPDLYVYIYIYIHIHTVGEQYSA